METTLAEFRKECIRGETNVEGGYVNDPTDLGKETNHGITIGLATRYTSKLKSLFGWNGQMKDLTQEMAFWLYEMEFWHPMFLDDVCKRSRSLARTMFRWGLKSGSDEPVMAVQETLNCLNNRQAYWPNIIADGWMGPKTLGTIDAFIKKRGRDDAMAFLVAQTNADCMHYMKHITLRRPQEKNEKYFWGWNIRVIREIAGYLDRYGIPRV